MEGKKKTPPKLIATVEYVAEDGEKHTKVIEAANKREMTDLLADANLDVLSLVRGKQMQWTESRRVTF